MDKEKALKVLLANACCYTEKSCRNCPFAVQNGAKEDKDCGSLNENVIIEAITVWSNQ